ncbi:MAG: hypothetical protein HY033_02240 [Ignavibacteriae bacterium]|nr:hypothetical protein [Ignavibacteriota bacterium]
MKSSLLALTMLLTSLAGGQSHPRLSNGSLGLDPRFSMSAITAGSHIDVFDQSENSGEKKSAALAAFYSLLLPGMGELYSGNYGMGKYFTIAEGGLVIALVGMDRYANWLQDDARRYSVQHAQVKLDGKDDRFFNAIGNFNDVDAYNEQVLRSRDPEKTYDPAPNSAYYWKWDNPANREGYRDLRVSSDERFNDTRFIAAAIGVNHLVSAINAARLAISHNKSMQHGSTFDLHADVIGGIANPSGIKLTLTRTF